MAYFTSNYYKNGIIIDTNSKPFGAVTEKIKSEYPQSHIKIKRNPPHEENTLPQEEATSKTAPEPKKYSSFGTIKTALIVFLLYMFAVQTSNLSCPEFINNIYMTAFDVVSETCNAVYAAESPSDLFSFVESYESSKEDNSPISENNTVNLSEDLEKSTNSGFYFKKYIEKKDITSENPVSVSTNAEKQDTNTVVKRDLSRDTDKIYLQNETKLSPDMDTMAVSAYPIDGITYGEELPQVLIVHTHGTESYCDSKGGTTRSTNCEENVVRVGRELEKMLNFYGIPTLHSETMHDEHSYITAYSSSKKEIKRILEQHPSIKYVIDLHRDALPAENSTPVKPYTEIGGEGTAQIMMVMGTNAGGGNHPNYMKNLTVAAHLQSSINELYPTLARPINIRNAIFNQDLCTGSILLEVGSDANTLDEALRAVRYFGEAFARVIKAEI